MNGHLTNIELCNLFGLNGDSSRWIVSADSAEYLELVTYLAQRSNNRGATTA